MDVDERLRAARPPVPDAEPDRELLTRVMREPVARRTRRPLALPAVAVVALAAAAIVLAGGDRPDSAVALSQAMRWFDPPAGKVVHSVMVDDAGRTREFWQDLDRLEGARMIEPSGLEVAEGAIFDPATNTIYEDDGERPAGKGPDANADAIKRAKLAADKPGRAGVEPATSGRTHPREIVPRGDPLVTKVRVLIDDGRAAVRGREVHDGVEAWKITLTDTADRDPWVLWVRADDGKPLAIDDPGNPARGSSPTRSRWTTYEVLDRDAAPLTLRAAHPDATVVHDGARFDALLARVAAG